MQLPGPSDRAAVVHPYLYTKGRWDLGASANCTQSGPLAPLMQHLSHPPGAPPSFGGGDARGSRAHACMHACVQRLINAWRLTYQANSSSSTKSTSSLQQQSRHASPNPPMLLVSAFADLQGAPGPARPLAVQHIGTGTGAAPCQRQTTRQHRQSMHQLTRQATYQHKAGQFINIACR
jgi:hypothetical protein